MRIKVALLVCTVALLGCSDDPTSPTGASGSLSFSYTGAGATASTSFNASGTIPTGGSLGAGSWAAGGISETSNYVVVGAAISRTSATWDITSIGIARKTVGTSSIDPNCVEDELCTGVFVTFGQGQTDATFSYTCALTTGSVTISAISSTNASGTFSGTGFCYSPAGAETAFTVTNGSFNVGITSEVLE